MKILNNEQVLKPSRSESNTKAQPPTRTNFNAILREAAKNTTASEPTPTPSTSINLLPIVEPTALSPSDHRLATDRIENMLNLLDRYREKLANSRMTMKQIDPEIKEMAQTMENLGHVLDSLPAEDGLRDILNRTMVTISLEIGKFYRGDYISA
jgi:hypothetical protein